MAIAGGLRLSIVTQVLLSTSVYALQYVGQWEALQAANGGGLGIHLSRSKTTMITTCLIAVGRWQRITWETSNLTTIEQNFELAGTVALYPISWTVPQKNLCYAPVTHQQTSPNGTFSCITIDPDYKAKWMKQWLEIKPLVDKGAIKGIFLGDEHLYFGVQLNEVKLIADEVRRTYSDAIIYMNEAPDVTMCNYRKDNTTVFQTRECIPVNVDWFGMDYYSTDSTSWTGPLETLNSIMGPRFSRVTQKWIPTTIGHNFNTPGIITPEDDAFCVENAMEWMKIAFAEPRIAAIFTFGGQFGASDTSRCSQIFQSLGNLLRAVGSQGTSLDPVGPPPVATQSGEFIEPECISPRRMAPSSWNWCDRSSDRLWTCDEKTKTCVKSVVGTYATAANCSANCLN